MTTNDMPVIVTEAEAQLTLAMAQATLLADLARRGIVPLDVTPAHLTTHRHKVGTGAGLWFRLPDGRVFDQWGSPSLGDPALYDQTPIALVMATALRFRALTHDIAVHREREEMFDAEYEAMVAKARRIYGKWQRRGWAPLALIDRLCWLHINNDDPARSLNELREVLACIETDVSENLVAEAPEATDLAQDMTPAAGMH